MSPFAAAVMDGALDLFLDAAPFLLGGFLLAGVVRVLLPVELVTRYLGTGTGGIFRAALIGTPLPLCSCSVLPTAATLRAQGAGKGATSAFLIATPETGVDSLALTWALMGPAMTLARPLAAVATAVTAGLAEERFGDPVPPPAEPSSTEEHCQDCGGACASEEPPETAPFTARVARGFRYAAVNLMDDLAGWMVAGFGLAGLFGALLPDRFFDTLPLGDAVAMPIMLAAGIPLYLCATASTPLAAALMAKGLSPGAALVFLLAGPATNIGAVAVVRRLLGTRSTVIYLASISLSAVACGLLLNATYDQLGLSTAGVAAGEALRIPPAVETATAALLGLLMLRALLAKGHRWLRGRRG